ncbi:MAG: MerR family transcriptional regulator [Bernardetiaceae bacterium]
MRAIRYSIKDLENLTGIKAHTIRMWEQRYNIVEPKRTETNIRYYDPEDLKRMLNISLLNQNGFKISRIAKMKSAELHHKVRETIAKASGDYQSQIKALTVAMIELDEEQFEKVMSTNILQIGFEKTMIEIVYPFLMRVGTLWTTDAINPSQEHFITNLIRQKIIVAIDGQVTRSDDRMPKYMLYLPSGELHEISLLFSYYLLKSRGNHVVYLGQSLPLDDLEEAYKIHRPDFILTLITSVPGAGVQSYLDQLSEKFPEATTLVSGYQIVGQYIQPADNIVPLAKVQDLVTFAEEQKQLYQRMRNV